jgi:hypothetical protein
LPWVVLRPSRPCFWPGREPVRAPAHFPDVPPPLLDRLQEFASALLKSSPKAAAAIGVDSQIRASGRPLDYEAPKPQSPR